MRFAGGLMVIAGIAGALAVPLMGTPGAFAVLSVCAMVLWFTGAITAAACVAPPRRAAGIAAIAGGLLGWPLLLVYGLAPLWGLLAAAGGVTVIARRTAPAPRGAGAP